MTAAPPRHGNPFDKEPSIALPGAAMVSAMLAAAAIVGLVWLLITRLGGWASDVQTTGLIGAAIAGGVGVFGILIIGPAKTRPISTWMNLWLAAMVARLFITPAITYLLYSAASLNATALALSVGSAYLAVLLAEAIVLARHVGKVVHPVSVDSGSTNELQVPKGS